MDVVGDDFTRPFVVDVDITGIETARTMHRLYFLTWWPLFFTLLLPKRKFLVDFVTMNAANFFDGAVKSFDFLIDIQSSTFRLTPSPVRDKQTIVDGDFFNFKLFSFNDICILSSSTSRSCLTFGCKNICVNSLVAVNELVDVVVVGHSIIE